MSTDWQSDIATRVAGRSCATIVKWRSWTMIMRDNCHMTIMRNNNAWQSSHTILSHERHITHYCPTMIVTHEFQIWSWNNLHTWSSRDDHLWWSCMIIMRGDCRMMIMHENHVWQSLWDNHAWRSSRDNHLWRSCTIIIMRRLCETIVHDDRHVTIVY